MDWKKTFSFGNWLVHFSFFISLICLLGVTLYTLRLNQSLSEEKKNLEETQKLLTYFKTQAPFEETTKFLSRAETGKALSVMEELIRQIARAEGLLEAKASKELGQKVREFQNLLSQNSGLANPSDALKVFTNKVNSLKSVAASQNYRKILEGAEQMQERLENLTSKNVGGSIQVSYLRSDLARLKRIVESSSLSDGEKNGLLSRFSSMQSELDLLSSLTNQSKSLQSHSTAASLALANWTLELEKKVASFDEINRS